jgi:ribose 5-phosphate isomerase A
VTQDELKEQAARKAVELVEPGMMLGLGTGSTARRVLEALAERRKRGELDGIVGVPTSSDTKEYATKLEIPLASLDEAFHLDMTLDGADEVDPGLELVKGLGGALLWEKIVAGATGRLVIVVDQTKLVDTLASRSPVPVEVVPFGWRTLVEPIQALGAEPVLRQSQDGDAFITDGGHYILDCTFPDGLEDPYEVEAAFHTFPGVVETGLFLGMAETVVVGTEKGPRILRREPPAGATS